MRVTVALLFTTTSRKPGSWCVKPLWSCRQTVEVISRFTRQMSLAPGKLIADRQPFRMLIEHGVDDVDEGLVGREETVAAGQADNLPACLPWCAR